MLTKRINVDDDDYSDVITTKKTDYSSITSIARKKEEIAKKRNDRSG